MKKIIFSALMICLFIGSISAQKFGHLNSRALLSAMPEMTEANSNLEALAKQLQKQGEGMIADLQAKYTALEKDIAAGNLSQVQQQAEGEKFQAEQEKLALFEKEMTLKIQKREAELLQPILEKINVAIKSVAEENEFQFIFDQGTQMLLFAQESTDVMDMVKSKLGI